MKQFLVLFSLFISVGTVFSSHNIPDNTNKNVKVSKGTTNKKKEQLKETKKDLSKIGKFQNVAPISSLTSSKIRKLTKNKNNNK